jgi:hypothetical protein
MHGADFVTTGIAQIGEIQLARGPFAPAGRVLDAFAAVGDARVVEGLDLLGVGARETDGAPLACVAALPSIGLVIPNEPVLV